MTKISSVVSRIDVNEATRLRCVLNMHLVMQKALCDGLHDNLRYLCRKTTIEWLHKGYELDLNNTEMLKVFEKFIKRLLPNYV